MKQVLDNLYLYEDTCHVYVVKNGQNAVLIDFGSGDVLDELHSIGVRHVAAILMTHHHRDQGQGLKRANEKDIPIWVPAAEKDLFAEVDRYWQSRELDNNYNMRQDRFSLLQSVFVEGTLIDYKTYTFGDLQFEVIPTPGHTTGSVSFLTEISGKRVVFTGDLLAGPGKVWSLAATQWSYNGGEGLPFTILSLLDVKEKKTELLLPSHGEIIDEPASAIDSVIERLSKLVKLRKQNPRLFQLRSKPYEEITPHLLKNRTSCSNAYVLLSANNKALLIDFGYDFIAGTGAGFDRSSRRPWLYTIKSLKEQYGVEKIDVALPTHYHDDHVAGFNLLKEIEGTEIWCPENFSDVLENPKSYNLPCLWYDSIAVDRILPLKQTFQWEEYQFTLHEQSGHTYYAVAIEFEVDGKKVLAIGDQYEGDHFNYVYHNGFRMMDYQDSAALYKQIRPDLLIAGHCEPIEITDHYLVHISQIGQELEKLHRDLLPLEEVDFGAEGFGAKIMPYQTIVKSGETTTFTVQVKNPFSTEQNIQVELIVPDGWIQKNCKCTEIVEGNGTISVLFQVTVPFGLTEKRERIAVDLTVGNRKFGQHAEAVITISNKL
ncbi:MBL fold metallo-hydrolase [Halalkalibacter kiskunsagensis]|uniref:MBL fold metallo-hydrolase n=1 Tax=Halalkalibacter kiskunsagensis TaxID=1548599 RepID=A0ABV6KFT6_9BACI